MTQLSRTFTGRIYTAHLSDEAKTEYVTILLKYPLEMVMKDDKWAGVCLTFTDPETIKWAKAFITELDLFHALDDALGQKP